MNPDNMPPPDKEHVREQVEPLRIMLLGKSGAGKSSSGNTILGKKVFKSDMKLARVTQFCEKEAGKVGDADVSVIDTPGLFETNRKMEETARDILKCVKLVEPGPHAFAFVIPIGRMTQEDQNTIQLIENKFGPRVWDYTIVLFTHGDRLEQKTVNDIITESEDNLRSFIRKCSGGFHVFNNKEQERQEKQVTTFIEKIHTLVALNGGGHYKSDLYPEEERKIRERQESILAERAEKIGCEETQLLERYQERELEEKMKTLWRKEEDDARKTAEDEKIYTIYMFKFMLVWLFLIMLMICFLSVTMTILLNGGIVMIILCVYFKLLQKKTT